MRKNWKQRWRRKVGPVIWSALGLGLIVLLVWMAVGHLDLDDPTVALKPLVDVVGAKTVLTVSAADQDSGLKEVKVTFSQGNQSMVVLDRTFPPGGGKGETVNLPVTLEPKALGFKEGKAKLVIEAWDRSWRHLFRGRIGSLSRDVVIDLVPVNLTYQGASHLLYAGGAGVLCYHLNKDVKECGVLVDGHFFRGFPNPKGTKGDFVVLFPVPQEGPRDFQVELVARPSLGTEVKQAVTLREIPRKWRHDKINLSDSFLRKVATTLPVSNPSDLLGSYLEVNRNLRKLNHETFRKVCAQSNPQPLWVGSFKRFDGKRMARFGDRRTYMYQGKAVDQETHLGADLASVVHSPVYAGNNGVVVFTGPLGIYGNTVILDHGLGVFSSYSHMSKIDVKVGDKLAKGTVLGQTGSTGLAAGDHLHFAINLQGEFVSPLEWWDPHWIKDQVEGVWDHAGAAVQPAAAASGEPKKAKGKRRSGKTTSKAKGKKKRN
jgi:murein DD-endopeptidase MepM/ murein hydrolase activator NlpD